MTRSILRAIISILIVTTAAIVPAAAQVPVSPLIRGQDPNPPTGEKSPFERAVAGEGGGDERGGEDHIETDRDSFTPSTKTAGQGRLIVETGYSFIDNRNSSVNHSFPELVLRYGI